jgi:DNA gyrase subunit A
MVTRNGTVKRVQLDTLKTSRKAGIRALTIDEDDELIAVHKTDGNQCVIIATRNGRAICFDENDVRVMGRDAMGVRGIRLEDGDIVIGAAIARPGATFLTITENGYGKRTPVEEYVRGSGDEENKQEDTIDKSSLSAAEERAFSTTG